MKKLEKIVIPQLKRIINELNGDVVILVTSNIYGGGKSTLSVMLAKQVWRGFSFRQHMSYPVLEFMKLLRNQNVKVIVQDEGKRLGKRTDFMQKKTKDVEDVLSEARKLNKCIFINVGEIHRIFKWLGNERAIVWLHIPMRGQVMVFQARNYIMKGNKFAMSEKLIEGVKSQAQLINRLTSLPSFCFVDTFPQYSKFFTEEEYVEYEERAEGKTYEMIDDVIERLEGEEVQQKQKAIDDKIIAAEIIARNDYFISSYGKRTFVDTKKIMAEWDCGYTKARKIKGIAELELKQMGLL